MNEYLREAIYRPLRDEENKQRLEEVAKKLSADPDFVRIDWIEYQSKKAMLLRELVALSIGINPSHYCAKPENANTIAAMVIGDNGNRLLEGLKRLRVSADNLSKKFGRIRIAKDHERDAECLVSVEDFVTFAQESGWDLPDALLGNNRKDVAIETGGAAKQRDGEKRTLRKRRVLVAELEPIFPDIEKYLSEASRLSVGLKEANVNHGTWWLEKVIQCGFSDGKIKKTKAVEIASDKDNESELAMILRQTLGV